MIGDQTYPALANIDGRGIQFPALANRYPDRKPTVNTLMTPPKIRNALAFRTGYHQLLPLSQTDSIQERKPAVCILFRLRLCMPIGILHTDGHPVKIFF